MKKVRVFDLAKDYGMKGPDLAKLLREIGFDNVKSHMTVLDDADLMLVEARLSTQGLRKQGDAPAPAPGLKKKLPLDAGGGDSPESDEAPQKKELPKKALPRKRLVKHPGEAGAEGDGGEDHAAETPAPTKPTLPSPVSEQPRVTPAPLPEPEPARIAPIAEPPAPSPERTPAAAKQAEPAAPTPQPPTEPQAGPKPAPASEARPAQTPAPAQSPPTVENKPAATAATPAPTRAPEKAVPAPTAATAAFAAASAAAAKAPSATPPTSAPAVPASGAGTAKPSAKPTTPERTPAVTGDAAKGRQTGKPPAAGEGAEPELENDPVKKLLMPQQRATVVGRIELPQETIRDATRRSAPQPARDLRRAALQRLQQRSGSRVAPQPGQRRGPATRTGRDAGRTAGPGGKKSRVPPTVDPNKIVEVEEPVSIKALSEGLGIKVNELIATLTFKLGVAGKNINSYLTNEEVELVAMELDRKIKVVEHKEAMDELIAQLDEGSADEESVVRAPVVTFMGHVDHGKTTLMDVLHDSSVAKGEAGGITQHIGAYKVTDEEGRSIVILDTPGHAAFTAMRARGAELTDIVVLVVAADDGVMPQTEEAINHAKAAGCPVVVAITKCDLPGAKPMQVKQQLMIKGLQSEDFGGEIGMVEVSAVTKKGLPELFDRIQLEAEILELRAQPDAPGKGIVVESRQSPEQGVVVTLLVIDGTLRLKDQIVCGESYARVRAMIDDRGIALDEAGPSTPITLFGLDRLPVPGDKLFVVEDAKKAREVVEERQRRVRELSRAERSAVTLETLSAKLAEREMQEIKIILKADAMGSLEPLRKCLDELTTPEVRVNLVHSALGGINETDVSLASASGAVIVGFNTVADSNARQLAERAGVEIRYYDVIYELLDQVRAAMEGLLAPEEVQSVIGHAEIRATFKSSKFGVIAGLRILDGVAKRNATARLSRDGAVVWSGKIGSLRRVDEDVREVKAGLECGMTLDGFQDVKVGDQLEFVQVELVKRTLGG